MPQHSDVIQYAKIESTETGTPMFSTEKKEEEKSKTEQSKDDFIPFMDAFWVLADESVEKRAYAAKSLLVHCFSSSNSNTDAAYTLRRLLDGLNSGRACARQGFASCLSSFLKITCTVEERKEALLNDLALDRSKQEPMEFHEFLRKELLDRTNESPVGCNDDGFSKNKKKKGSEKRDHAFGRLFGILALCRSGILCEAPIEVINGYMRDLIDLLLWRKWMRESCAHAIIEFIESLMCKSTSTSENKAKAVVEVVLIPELLQKEIDSDTVSPEGIGICLYIERLFNMFVFNGKKSVLLTTDEGLMKKICLSLANTASATTIIANNLQKNTKQRQHIVWKQIWQVSSTPKYKNQMELLSFIFSQFVEKYLLSANNNTAERRTLALSLVFTYTSAAIKNGSDGVLISAIERYVLSPVIVQKLFLHTISATKGHILKELAEHVLGVLVNARVLEDKSTEIGSHSYYTALIKAFIKADPKFDSKTKSNSVSGIMSSLNKYEMSGIVDFLIAEILRELNSDQGTEYIDGIFNLLCNATKIALNNKNFGNDTTAIVHLRIRVLSFFMVGAFFDCKDLQPPKKPGKKANKVKDREMILLDARGIQKETKTEVPYKFRRMMSTRFFSLLSDYIVTPQIHQNVVAENDSGPQRLSKAENALGIFNPVMNCWDILENNGAKLYSKVGGKDGEDNGVKELRTQTQNMQKIANEYLNKEKKGDSEEDSKSRAIIGCGTLLISLFIQQLRCGSSVCDDNEIQDDDEQDEEEEQENIEDLMNDLIHANSLIICKLDGIEKNECDEEDDNNPLVLLADVCLSTLALFDQSKSSSRSTRLLRETSKMAWSGSLIAAASSGGKLAIDRSVMEVVLDAVCDVDDSSEEDVEMEDVDETDGDDNSDVGEVFTSANEAGLETEENAEKQLGEVESPNSAENDADDVEVNSEQLKDLLLDDKMDESDDDDFQLEHHAGADAALAQLIKLKRDTRKKAKDEKERMENAHRLRCFVLMESMFGGRNDSSLFESGGVVLMSLLPILQTRRKLERAVNLAENGNKTALVAEKKSLCERLTTLLKSKIYKTKVVSKEKVEDIKMLASELLDEAKKGGSINHCSCCSHAILLLVKYVEDITEKCRFVQEIYAGALEDWSTKRSTKLHTNLFDDIISRFPIISRQSLLSPIIKAAREGRNTFLKTESLRLLSELYNTNAAPSGDDSEDSSELSVLLSFAAESVAVINEVLQDEEVSKAKRVRDIINACERLVAFCTKHCTTTTKSDPLWTNLNTMSSQLDKVREETGSEKIQKICTTLKEQIAIGRGQLGEEVSKEKDTNTDKKGDATKAKKIKKKSSKKKSKKR